MRLHRRITSVALLVALLLPLLPAGTAAAQGRPPQVRGMWVDASNAGFHNPAEVDELIENAANAGLNTLFVQMRRHGDAWYNRGAEPHARSALLAPAESFDPLDDLLAKAHARGIAVHAWLVIAVACRDHDPLRGDPGHVCTQHGPGAPDPERWTTATANGEQVGDLDFGHPAAVQYVENVVQTLLRNYPALDGIHYDFIRYGGASYGYNAVSLARFNAAHGLPADNRPAPGDQAWSQWRRDRITELVRRLYIRIKAINPRVQVSAATITWGGLGSGADDWWRSSAFGTVFQDWPAWLNEGILDFAVPMHYFSEGEERTRNWYDSWLAFDRVHTGRRAIVAGTGAWLNDPQQGIAQLRRALLPDDAGRSLSGVALYAYSQPISNSNPQWRREYMLLLRASLFFDPTPPPIWPWIANPTTGHLQGIATVDGQIAPDAKITLFREGQWQRDFNASVDGWFGAVELAPGSYSVVITTADGRSARLDGVTVRPGLVTSL